MTKTERIPKPEFPNALRNSSFGFDSFPLSGIIRHSSFPQPLVYE